MVVYLDLLILDNFCADAALLYCAVKTVKGEAKFWRIFLTALLGTALGTGYAVFKLYFTVPAAVDFLVKYGVAAVLPLPAARFKRKRTYALCSLAFVGYMFAFAGMMTALFFKISPNAGEGLLTYTLYGIPSGVLLGGCAFVAFSGIHIVKMLKNHGKNVAFVCRCTLTLKGKRVTLQGFTDTGNRLRGRAGEPVAVAERSAALALLSDGLLTGSTPCETIEVITVNGKSRMTAFKIDSLEIYSDNKSNIIKDVTVAISPRPLAGEYSLILPPAFTREEDFEDRGGKKC